MTGNNWGFALITLILTTDGSTYKIMAGPLCCVPGQNTLPQGASLHPGILQLANFLGHLQDAGVNLVIDKQLINTPCHFISVYSLGFCGKQILETKFPSPISCK